MNKKHLFITSILYGKIITRDTSGKLMMLPDIPNGQQILVNPPVLTIPKTNDTYLTHRANIISELDKYNINRFDRHAYLTPDHFYKPTEQLQTLTSLLYRTKWADKRTEYICGKNNFVVLEHFELITLKELLDIAICMVCNYLRSQKNINLSADVTLHKNVISHTLAVMCNSVGSLQSIGHSYMSNTKVLFQLENNSYRLPFYTILSEYITELNNNLGK